MQVNTNKYFLIFTLIILQACSTGGLEDRKELKTYFVTGAYDKGLDLLEKSKYFQDKNERLLGLMEKGMFLHLKEDFDKSSLVWDQARNLSNELYTISISKKAEKAVLNDNYDIYYGEIYEQSMLYFYLSLNSILTYQNTKKRDELFHARAEVLAWDSFLATTKEDRLGKSVYKNDLLLKIYGAKIHEIIDTREDKLIALQLYKDARDVLFKNYNSYPSFNENYKLFKSDYEKLASMSPDVVKGKYIKGSELQKELQDYISQNINRLTKKETIKKGAVSKTLVTLILQKGIISEKIAEKSSYSLDFLGKEPLIGLFVANVLGLTPNANSYNPGGAFLGMGVAMVALNTIGINFELPKIQNQSSSIKQKLTIFDLNNKEVMGLDVPLINPMGDIAEEAVYENSKATYVRVGTRLVAKHATAIGASFATYKLLGGGTRNESFLAKNAAVIQYAGASKLIEASEKADTRFWSTLPEEIRLLDFDLEPGKYRLELSQGPTEKLSLGNIVIPAQSTPFLINIRKN